jgi:chemotaxis protein MotB
MARKKARQEWHHENSERWLLTYADMITLLMLFFIVLYSMSNVDTEKFKEMSEALQSIFSGGNFTIFADQSTVGQGVLSGVRAGDQVKSSRGGGRQQGTGGRSALSQHATSSLQNLIKSGRVKVIPTENGIAISLISDHQFASGSADLSQEALPVLQQVSDFLTRLDNSIVVEGNTDNTAVDSTKWESNWQLSAARGLSVLTALEAYGVPEKRMSLAAYGDTRPVRSNDTPEGRAYNRRVDIVIVSKD